jgi:pimeloyl-ACP methyl ester carboxylesterase
MDRLLEANLVEHRIEAALDAPSAERFSAITARTLLIGGTKSPAVISQQLVAELAKAIPHAAVAILRGLDHLAPQHHPGPIAAAVVSDRSATQPVPSGPARTTRSTPPPPSTDAPAQLAPPRER